MDLENLPDIGSHEPIWHSGNYYMCLDCRRTGAREGLERQRCVPREFSFPGGTSWVAWCVYKVTDFIGSTLWRVRRVTWA